jgi:hypothetical protein
MNLLWVGTGMGDYSANMWWVDAFNDLFDNGLQLDKVKLIDLAGKPKLFFSERWVSHQEAEKADFFRQSPGWDIIILDFIEAWVLGFDPEMDRDSWPNFTEIPYDSILGAWEDKLFRLKPFQVWVVHDGMPKSTIIPELDEKYDLLVKTRFDGLRRSLEVDSGVEFWDYDAVKNFTKSKYLDVWQLGATIPV